MDCDVLTSKVKAILNCHALVERLKQVEGHLLDIEAYTLMAMAQDGPATGVLVEIGSFMGKSTCALALGSKAASREVVYAVDHFRGSEEHQAGQDCESPAIAVTGTTYPQFRQNIKRVGVDDHVRVIKKPSREAVVGWKEPIRLLFIDGDHSYDASREDFELWSPHVVPGGLILFHDIDNAPGVTRFYRELLAADATYQEIFGVYGLCVVAKAPG